MGSNTSSGHGIGTVQDDEWKRGSKSLPKILETFLNAFGGLQFFEGFGLRANTGQSGVPFVNVQAGLYASNFLGPSSNITKQADGTFALEWAVRPTTVLPVIDIDDDYGLFVRQILELPVFPDGTEVYTASEDISVEDITRQLSAATGKTVVFKQVTVEEWQKSLEAAAGLPPAIATELIEMFRFFDDVGYYGGQPSASREGLARPTRTWAEFARSADWSKILA